MIKKLTIATLVLATFFTSVGANEDMSQWLRPQTAPQPANNKLTPERIELGKLLYFDTRLSKNDKISCATCHSPSHGWTDEVPAAKAVGFEGRVGPRNSPVVLNSAYQRHQFWDGRAKSLEEQALGPIEADVEMNMPLKELIPKLNKIKGYRELFEKAYPGEGITKDSLAKAIASFERTVVSTESPFDKYAKGDKNAINTKAKKGFELFKGKAHCIDCHDGFNFSDGSFQNIGLNKGELKGKELGRYNVKKRAAWYGVFKTPTLRDVTKSAPYFHDGSVKTLKEATVICSQGGRYQDGVKNKSDVMVDRHLSDDEVDAIVEFMKALTGPDLDIKVPKNFPQ
ncbi:cytochrome c peroxidase [Sulfurimonas sp.]|uniref:cytochrome-c peroxidase n=1 Tax=Sulfurimonas sp. TaxID=2022749 RepID=UPI002611006B|nr:cytochrome c peroxidase [Sulfurimonas sp.]